ncbi:hypothetical protein J1N35_021528 [Gossypium stocksii]|uniref:Uncharacterized protein n=1 Tax=Gossypium stocksii TaxID=47602 RepID=A0A9D3VFW3_9ROSI|nr:hypothetical protein J1N35_021528 [Gossypium stocksii]
MWEYNLPNLIVLLNLGALLTCLACPECPHPSPPPNCLPLPPKFPPKHPPFVSKPPFVEPPCVNPPPKAPIVKPPTPKPPVYPSPPVVKPPLEKTPCPPPPPTAQQTCPIDTLKLGTCVDVFGPSSHWCRYLLPRQGHIDTPKPRTHVAQCFKRCWTWMPLSVFAPQSRPNF